MWWCYLGAKLAVRTSRCVSEAHNWRASDISAWIPWSGNVYSRAFHILLHCNNFSDTVLEFSSDVFYNSVSGDSEIRQSAGFEVVARLAMKSIIEHKFKDVSDERTAMLRSGVRNRTWSCGICGGAKWRWGRFSPSSSVSPAIVVRSTNYSTITLIYHPGNAQ
jgi:hypothetical protein